MNGKARIPLTRLPREIAKLTGGPAPSYRQLYSAVLNGTIPAEQRENGRYDCGEHDVPAIAERFGLTLQTAA
jgi:hypothetical protein